MCVQVISATEEVQQARKSRRNAKAARDEDATLVDTNEQEVSATRQPAGTVLQLSVC